MHKTLKKVEKERLADMIKNIIKRMSKKQIAVCVSAEAKNLSPKFKDPDFVTKLNDIMIDFNSSSLSTVTVGGCYNGFSDYVKTKYIKKGTKITSKDIDALFYLFVYDLALCAFDSRQFRKQIGIKKGFFG